MRKLLQFHGSFAAIALSILTSAPAYAADQPGLASPAQQPEGDSGGGDIVVTAQKRSERLQDVPVSITAIGGSAIQDARIERASQLTSMVPNLTAVGSVGESQPVFSLRGVSMNDYSLNQGQPVATYYDEVYKGNFAILGVALYDIERVEVLRGPQGTLYGKNTTGGAVNLISKIPTFKTEGYLNLTTGNYGRYAAEGALQAPITDTVAARLAFTFNRANGVIKNLLPGQPDQQSTRNWAARLSVLFAPNDRFKAILRASTSYDDPYHFAIAGQNSPSGIGAGVYDVYHALEPSNPDVYIRPASVGRRESVDDDVQRSRNLTYAVSLNMTQQIGDSLALTSVTSYDFGRFYYGEDSDGSPLKQLEQTYFDSAKQFTQDLRLATTGSGPFKALIGAYFNDEKVYNRTELPLYQDVDTNLDGKLNHLDCVATFPIACNIVNHFNQHKQSFALYSDLSYRFSEKFTIRGGLRYTHDKGALLGFTSQAFGTDGVLVYNLIPGSTTDLNATADRFFSTDNISGKIGLDFKANQDLLLYASYSVGYRGRSFNAQAFFAPEELNTAAAEILKASEVGFKSSLFDRRLTFNGAAFYYSYHNQQFLNTDPVTASQTLGNLPRSRIYGAEFEISARPTQRFSLSASIGLLNTKVLEGTLYGEDIRGAQLASAPKFTSSGSIDWDVIEGDWGKIRAHADASYTSTRFFDLTNEAATAQKPYGLINARLGWKNSTGKLGVSAWVRNLTDQYYATDLIDILAGYGSVYTRIGEPRTFGGTLELSF